MHMQDMDDKKSQLLLVCISNSRSITSLKRIENGWMSKKFLFFTSIAIRYWNRLGLAKQQRNQFGSDNNRAGDVPYLSQ